MTDAHLFDPDPGSLFADVTWDACTHPDDVRLALPQLADVPDPGGLLSLVDGNPPQAGRQDAGEPDESHDPYEHAACDRYISDRITGMTGEHCATCGWPSSEHIAPDDDGHDWTEHDAAVFDASRPYLCTCGHLRQDHPNAPRFASPCDRSACDCPRYTHDPDPDPDEHARRAAALRASAAIRARLTERTTPTQPDDEPDDEADADELADDEPARGAPTLDPDRCAAYRWGYGDRSQCVRAPGHRTDASPHVYGWQIDRAANSGRADIDLGGWGTGCTWGDIDGTAPAAPDGSCLAYVENRDDRDDNDDAGPDLDDDQHGAYAFRGACACGWRGPVREDDHAEERAYFDAADHAHPGWRDLPALRALGYEPTKKRAAAYEHDRAALIPASWTGPIRQHREHPCGHRWGDSWGSDRGAVPGRVAGNVEVCACPCHMSDDPNGWHATHAPDESAPADLATAAPALF